STLKSPSYTKSVSWQHYLRMNIAPEQGMAMFCEIHCAYHNCG
ncbi:transposase, partial [Shigella flexneri]